MKKLILMLVCAFATLSMAAQTKVTWNMELGLGMSGWMGKHSDGSKGLFSPKVGVGLDIPLTGLVSFQSGLMWVSKGASYEINDLDLTDDSKVHVNQNYFQMPLLAAFHVGTAADFDMVFTAGPYLAYGVCGKSEIEEADLTFGWDTFKDTRFEDEAVLPGFNRFDAGLQLGIGLDFGKWTAGLDGEFSFCKVASGDSPRNIGFYLKAGYKF